MFSYEITSPTEAKNSFFELLYKLAKNHQVFLINRQERENVALIAESNLVNLVETVYLLRSPANASRLFAALE
ncbi:prevent-host-death family protein [Rippkaea orientalis PCC 8801]|uniref:Antitoxin n=1 Tax=Rippkaea orientalis (strain PCC 8801 / RF-1) TaxID=41431 RepID=B7K5Z9_RIPO1|nr:type II toxin-antitoxin system Phd/YefM family antitoxin [Rippkaea orientalis]ACK68052.1 prevent-host-death family protein [Rippkaea orientalis PCC 8801]